MRNIAITDIHGCLLTFKKLLDKVNYSKTDHLYLLGDYIDRGPRSKEVLDYIMDLQDQGHEIICLMGNHEQKMLDIYHKVGDSSIRSNWLQYGGVQTLHSFNISSVSQLPLKHVGFMDNLLYYHEVDDFILVHAGLNFETLEDPLSLKHSQLWIRYWYDDIDYDWLDGRKIIHGHTPTKRFNIKEMYSKFKSKSYLNIDAGCYYKNEPGLGHLCAYDMTNHRIYFQENVE